MKNQRLIQLFFITCLFYTPFFPSKACNSICERFEILNSSLQTDFNITDVTTTFQILSNGKYSCNFILKVVGNSHTSQNDLSGQFKVECHELSDFRLWFDGDPINISITTLVFML